MLYFIFFILLTSCVIGITAAENHRKTWRHVFCLAKWQHTLANVCGKNVGRMGVEAWQCDLTFIGSLHLVVE